MSDYSVKFESRDVKRLLAAAPGEIRGGLRDGVIDIAEDIFTESQTYPPARSYVRTFRLKRSWSLETRDTAQGVQATVTSNGDTAPYNVHVQDEDRQASTHRERWRNTAQGMVSRRLGSASKNVAERIAARLGRLQ